MSLHRQSATATCLPSVITCLTLEVRFSKPAGVVLMLFRRPIFFAERQKSNVFQSCFLATSRTRDIKETLTFSFVEMA